MPPAIALLICSYFVFLLLRFDHAKTRHKSNAVWLATLWMLYVASKPLGRWLEDVSSLGNTADQLFLVALFVLAARILLQRADVIAGLFRSQFLLVAVVGFMLISIAWSEIPFISFKRWFRELVAVAMATVLLTESDPKEAMISVLRRSFYILIPFSLLLIKYYPNLGCEFHEWAGTRMWIGVTTQKNSLGRLCFLALFFFFWTHLRRKTHRDLPISRSHFIAELILLGITIHLFIGPPGATPATAYVTLAVGMLAYFIILWLGRRGIFLSGLLLSSAIAFIVAIGSITPLVGGATVGGLASFVGRDSTLTGRTGIWADLLTFVEPNASLGFGFGGFWTPVTIDIITVNEAHNGYLEVVLGLGVVGLLLTAAFLINSSYKAAQAIKADTEWGAFLYTVILMAVIHNISESSIDSFNRHLMANFLFLLVVVTTRLPTSPHSAPS